MASPAEAFERLLGVLDRMEIAYEVGGSVASSAYGIPRTTMDADFVAELKPEQIDEFAALLAPDFYADAATMRDAIERGRSFNLIHYESAYKFDVFPLRKDAYSKTEFGRRRQIEIRSFGPEPIECSVASPEDTILRKLEWYRAGGETSERQWNDLRGVLKISGARLDRTYMRQWAPALKVDDLLERLLAESR
ncbi:MAG TPA: hypothetical protein VN841_02315 [Bryobacteraceae bacterium]|nr:hypothetical protein [Bryobacteraceae bacterium]